MAQNIFRKTAIDRLSSPEELDKLLTVTAPRSWLALIGICLLLMTALIWGIFGNISTRVEGQGILLSKGGVYNVVHVTGGQITDVRVQTGDHVQKGDVLARIDQYETVTSLNEMKNTLAYLENLDSQNPQLPAKEIDSQTIAEILALVGSVKDAQAGLAEELAQARLQLEKVLLEESSLREDIKMNEKLYAVGGVSRQELEDLKQQLPLKEMECQIHEKRVQDLMADSQQGILDGEEAAWTDLTVSKQQLERKRSFLITELRARIIQTQQDLQQQANILSGVDGRVVEVNYQKGDLLQAGATVASIIREVDGDNSLQVLLYVAAEEGKKILPGMEVEVSPTIVQKEEDGYLLGKVVSVSEYPVSSQSMLTKIGNQDLAAQLSGQGAPMEVQVELIINDQTVSGYTWSTNEGPAVLLDSGTVCTGSVTVGEKRPISMVLPYIRKVLPL